MSSEKYTRITISLPNELVRDIDMVRKNDLSRAALIRLILQKGMQEIKRKGLQLDITMDGK